LAVTLPIPVFEPVTMAVLPSNLAALVHLPLNISTERKCDD
jgi:hypothetical protein